MGVCNPLEAVRVSPTVALNSIPIRKAIYPYRHL